LSFLDQAIASFLYQVARHTSRILPVSGEAPDEAGPASALSAMACGLPLSSEMGSVGVTTAPVVAPMLPPKAPVAGALGAQPKLSSNQLPPNVLAELQVGSRSLTQPAFLNMHRESTCA
jgi:hypothetical protein